MKSSRGGSGVFSAGRAGVRRVLVSGYETLASGLGGNPLHRQVTTSLPLDRRLDVALGFG